MTQQVEVQPVKQDIIQEPAKPIKNYFSELASVDVGRHIEKKQQFSYLSWAWAVHYLKTVHPDAVIKVREFPEASTNQMVPYLKTETGYYVQVDVTVNGITEGEPFGVTDNKNSPIVKPTTKDINNSIQRAKVKSIAAHGLGLYIYAGEDVPDFESTQPAPMNQLQISNIKALATNIAQLNVPQIKPKQVYEQFGLTQDMTAEMADEKIMQLNNLQKKLQHAKKTAEQQQQQEQQEQQTQQATEQPANPLFSAN